VLNKENLSKVAPDMPRTKSFFNEIKFGLFFTLTYPKRTVEFWWTLQAYFARLYIYFKAFQELRTEAYKADLGFYTWYRSWLTKQRVWAGSKPDMIFQNGTEMEFIRINMEDVADISFGLPTIK
jgi:hypothetical protein